VCAADHFSNIQGGPKKSKPDNFGNNFVYCHPIFIIFGIYCTHYRKYATGGYIHVASPPNMVCVIALPCLQYYISSVTVFFSFWMSVMYYIGKAS